MALNDGRVVSNFVTQALKNEPITIYGDGSQTRSFCYVADLVDGITKLLFSPQEVSGPINLGNPKEFTMLELANTIIKLTNSNSDIIFLPLPEDDPKQRKPDISLAINQLNWSPSIQIEEGLSLTIDDFKKRLVKEN